MLVIAWIVVAAGAGDIRDEPDCGCGISAMAPQRGRSSVSGMQAARDPPKQATGSGKRVLLLAVAGLLSASALLAIGILLVGHFGETESRILTTTALLAGYGLVGLPSTILLDQGRARRLAYGGLALAAGGAALGLTAVWTGGSPGLGKTLATVTVFALAAAQAAALTARGRNDDPASVRRLYALSCALAAVVAAMITALIWVTHTQGFVRVLAALVVLDLLVVALQPILARARPATGLHRLRLTVEGGETVELDVEAPDLATAAAKAIRELEQEGRPVRQLETRNGSSALSPPARSDAGQRAAGRCP